MANIKSQKKRIITNEKNRMRNRAIKSELKTATRKVKDAVAANNGADAYAFALEACRLMDKAVSKGVIKKNQAANRKSGIMKLANTVVTDKDRADYKKPDRSKATTKGNKKQAAKEERKKTQEKAQKEKDKRREAQKKQEEKALKRKEKEAKEQAEAEAAKAEEEALAEDSQTEEEQQESDEAAEPEAE